MVAMIASIHGYHSPLMPILSGDVHGKGKTEFFRRLMPDELKKYVGEVSPGIKDNDFHILMTQCLIILDDECGGKSKKDEMLQKSMLSKQYFNLREPYGRSNVTLQRIAMMCGTTNEKEILNDPTGNRRFIPIKFNSYDFKAYNSVDKTEMFMEAYNLYKQGYNYELTIEDIKYLNKYETEFERVDSAKELIQKYYIPSDKNLGRPMTVTDIKVYIEKETNQKLSLTRLGLELKKLGFEQIIERHGGGFRKVYYVKDSGLAGAADDSAANNMKLDEDLPY
jgi:predicted P-loop ATPase